MCNKKSKTEQPILPAYELEGWVYTDAHGTECEKVYQITGHWYLCQASMNIVDGTWTAELFWPDECGLRPCVLGSSLADVAGKIDAQIDILEQYGHGRVDCGGAFI